MKKIINTLKKHGHLSAFVMICVSILLCTLLLPDEQNYKSPRQEYADNDVKVG